MPDEEIPIGPDDAVPVPERITRSFEALIDDVHQGERTIVAKINTAALDLFQTVIDPLGGELEEYRKNPVVLWEHGLDPVRGRVPIGRNLWVKVRKQERDIIAKTQYGDDEFSRMIFGMYQGENPTLRMFSLGAMPDRAKCSPPTAAEVRARPELARCKMMYRAWRLDEYSSVAMGGNRETLALAVSRGLWVPQAVQVDLDAYEAEIAFLADARAVAAAEAEALVIARAARDAAERENARPTIEQLVAALPPLPVRPELPPLVGRRIADVRAERAALARALVRAEVDRLTEELDLRRGIV